MREIPVLKITLLLLHVIPVLNQTGPTHTQILDMIFVSCSTFEINTFFDDFFVYYSVFQKKITFDDILNLSRMNNSSIWCWKVLMIIIMAST